MTTALVVSPENDHSLASLSLDTMVIGHVRPKRGTAGLVARWVPDPRGESGLICSWVPQTRTERSVSLDA
jgi:hypothetical protein